MILTKEDFLRKLKNDLRNTTWVIKGGNRSRIRSLFKREKFSDNEIDFLWTINALRHEIVRTQKVSDTIIKSIIKRKSAVKKADTAIFTGMLINQELNQNIIDYLEYKLAKNNGIFIAWKVIPETMKKMGDFDNFLKAIDENIKDIAYNAHEMMTSIVNVSKLGKFELESILKVVIQYRDTLGNFLFAIAKTIYLDDDIIEYIKGSDEVEELLYFNFMEIVISRNNCSLNKKALFYLEMQ